MRLVAVAGAFMADRRILWLAAGVAGIALAGVVVIRLMPVPAAPPAQAPAPAPAIPLVPDAPPVVLDAPEPGRPGGAASDTDPDDSGDGSATTLFEAVWEEAELRLRLRFQRVDLAETVDFGRLESEMAVLCRDIGLPLVAAEGWPVEEIVVSFAERPLPVGVFDPEIMQVFEAYRIAGDDCIWEEF